MPLVITVNVPASVMPPTSIDLVVAARLAVVQLEDRRRTRYECQVVGKGQGANGGARAKRQCSRAGEDNVADDGAGAADCTRGVGNAAQHAEHAAGEDQGVPGACEGHEINIGYRRIIANSKGIVFSGCVADKKVCASAIPEDAALTVAVLFDELVDAPMLPVFSVNNCPLVSNRSELKKPPLPTWKVPQSTIEPELEMTRELLTLPAVLPTKQAAEFDQDEFGPLMTGRGAVCGDAVVVDDEIAGGNKPVGEEYGGRSILATDNHSGVAGAIRTEH